jgi:hypothetical protein
LIRLGYELVLQALAIRDKQERREGGFETGLPFVWSSDLFTFLCRLGGIARRGRIMRLLCDPTTYTIPIEMDEVGKLDKGQPGVAGRLGDE